MMMKEGNQSTLYQKAYENYREVAEYVEDYEGYWDRDEIDSDVLTSHLFDLQLQWLFTELSSRYENAMSSDEGNFVKSLIEHGEDLEQCVEGYRRFQRKLDAESFEALPGDIVTALKGIPIGIEIALEMDGGNRDEYTSVLFEQYALMLYSFAALKKNNAEEKKNAVRAVLDQWRDYAEDKNKGFVEPDLTKEVETMFRMDARKKSGEEESDEVSLESLLNELNKLIGLESVKENVNRMINLVRVNKEKESRGLHPEKISLHMVFTGNPGTGKTTVARLIARIYKAMGVLSTGQLKEVSRADMIAEYIGQTAPKVDHCVDEALGGILFIDEAYSLVQGAKEDFGTEAVTQLLKRMEDDRDNLVVIVAGYPDLMQDFLKSNPGLQSRFNTFIAFEDYTPDDMLDIFKLYCKNEGFRVSPKCIRRTKKIFQNYYDNRTKDFANGRDVRNFFEKAKVNQSLRMGAADISKLTNEELMELTEEDVDSISMFAEAIRSEG
ncbi:MAG: AAA family ATPase [Lachnospiraceae bacterium]|nr:AAA family ATPase [Lachnospiraceae bacterium]